MVQHSGLVPYTGAHASDPSHGMDWGEIMTWYLIGGTIFSIGSTIQQGPLDTRSTTCPNWQWEVGQQLSSISGLHLHSRATHGLCQGLDWRGVMSWYTVDGAAFIVRAIRQQEPWSIMFVLGGNGIRGDLLMTCSVKDWSGIRALKGPFMVG